MRMVFSFYFFVLTRNIHSVYPFIPFFFGSSRVFIYLIERGVYFYRLGSLSLIMKFKRVFKGVSSNGTTKVKIFVMGPSIRSRLFSFVSNVAMRKVPFIQRVFHSRTQAKVSGHASTTYVFGIFRRAISFGFYGFSIPGRGENYAMLK